MFVFGGFTDERNLYDDLYVLNVGKCLRKRIRWKGNDAFFTFKKCFFKCSYSYFGVLP